VENNEILRLLRDEVYSRHYQLNPNLFGGKNVTLFAECSKNPDHQPGNDDYFLLELHFSVDNHSPREHVVGLFIGREGMSKQEIDDLVDEFAFSQVADNFNLLVDEYLSKETVWQEHQDGRFYDELEEDEY